MTPSARTMAWLRERDWLAQVVERFNPYSKTRLDLFGVADILACQPLRGIVALQVTTGAHVANRKAKVEAEPRLRCWLLSGGQFWVMGWSKLGARGRRKLWRARIEVARIVDEQIVWSLHEEIDLT